MFILKFPLLTSHIEKTLFFTSAWFGELFEYFRMSFRLVKLRVQFLDKFFKNRITRWKLSTSLLRFLRGINRLGKCILKYHVYFKISFINIPYWENVVFHISMVRRIMRVLSNEFRLVKLRVQLLDKVFKHRITRWKLSTSLLNLYSPLPVEIVVTEFN